MSATNTPAARTHQRRAATIAMMPHVYGMAVVRSMAQRIQTLPWNCCTNITGSARSAE